MKKVTISLNSEYAFVLGEVIDQFSKEGFQYELTKNRVTPNRVEFIFDDPDEKSMFNLGARYGQALIKSQLAKESA